jgi:hypothetical protein
MYLGRATPFNFEQWNFVFERRAWDVDALLSRTTSPSRCCRC